MDISSKYHGNILIFDQLVEYSLVMSGYGHDPEVLTSGLCHSGGKNSLGGLAL